MSNIIPIRSNIIYSENEQTIVDEIQTRILLESQGSLNDFSPASPLSALSEGQAYAINFLGENVNDLPGEFVLKYLEVLGVNRSTARNSIVPIQFTKSLGFTNNVFIPAGFRMFTQEGVVFTLDNPVVLSEETPSLIGYATSVGVGTGTNVGENTITGFSLALPGLASINNPAPARGGADVESANQAISRGLSFLTFRHLTNPRDYEIVTKAIIGQNYTVKAYSYFEVQDFLFNNESILDTVDDLSRRNVYLVVSSNNGEGINDAVQNKVKNYLLPRLQSGTEVKFIQPEKLLINIDIQTTNNPTQFDINRMVTSLRVNQSILYRGIGQSLNNSSLYSQVEAFFPINQLGSTITDNLGVGILEFTSRNDNIVSPRPNTVFQMNTITVTTSNGLIYTYEDEI